MKQKNLFNIEEAQIDGPNPQMFIKDQGGWHIFDKIPDNVIEYFRSAIRYVNDGKFHIGQTYTKVPAKTIKCGHCNGENFHVGKDDMMIAIKCNFCGWETFFQE